MTDRAYFLSDVHLSLNNEAPEQRRRERLFRLFESIRETGGTLYIVGDFFDFWFEYKHAVPRYYYDVLAELRALVTAGVQVHYILGNHDYWTRDFLADVIGIQIHHQAARFTIGNRQVLLSHGDGLLQGERGYRIMRRIIRSRWFVFLYRWTHPDIGIAFAQAISRTSRNNQSHYYQDKDAYHEELIRYAQVQWEDGTDLVVLGHYHLNRLHTSDGGKQLLCLGDWISHFTYGKIVADELTLEFWPE